MTNASAHLFSNGHANYYNEKEKLIMEMRELGLSGLHKFVKEYPNASVYWCFSIYKKKIHPLALPYLLKHIRMETDAQILKRGKKVK